MARKGVYHEWLTEEKLAQIERWGKGGLTDRQIAKNIGISQTTLYDWVSKFTQFADALTRGSEIADRHVVNALYQRAMGYEYEEVIEEVTVTGKKNIKTIRKHIPPDVNACAIWLSNRRPNEWSHKRREEQVAREGGKIEIVCVGENLLEKDDGGGNANAEDK